jgi:hypothetical protein
MPTNTRTDRTWGAGRVEFLARLEAIRADRAAGWSIAAVYARHAMAEVLSRSQFGRYMRRYLRSASPRQTTRSSASSAPVACAPRAAAPAAATEPPRQEPVDLDAFGSRAVDLEHLARVHKQQNKGGSR